MTDRDSACHLLADNLLLVEKNPIINWTFIGGFWLWPGTPIYYQNVCVCQCVCVCVCVCVCMSVCVSRCVYLCYKSIIFHWHTYLMRTSFISRNLSFSVDVSHVSYLIKNWTMCYQPFITRLILSINIKDIIEGVSNDTYIHITKRRHKALISKMSWYNFIYQCTYICIRSWLDVNFIIIVHHFSSSF